MRVCRERAVNTARKGKLTGSFGHAGALARSVALVTGASSGIGRAILRVLAASGATVCGVGRDRARLAEVQRESPGVHTYSADLTIPSAVGQLLQEVEKDVGRVEILVHAAGIAHEATMQRSWPADLDMLYQTNVRAPYALTHALLPMLKATKGQVVFINSSATL